MFILINSILFIKNYKKEKNVKKTIKITLNYLFL